MDYQDSDNFKTINSASVGQPTASLTQHTKENSHSRLDQASCLTAAKAISGSYRRDEAHDPETFVAALALIFGDYPESIVQYAADPRTGVVSKFPMGLPNVGQIKEFCDGVLSRQERIARYSSLGPEAIRAATCKAGTDHISAIPRSLRAHRPETASDWCV
jgi:hypothetical protein